MGRGPDARVKGQGARVKEASENKGKGRAAHHLSFIEKGLANSEYRAGPKG